MKSTCIIALMLAAGSTAAFAQTYNIDPNHTFPSFEADHGGMSIFRGKFTKTSGKVVLDRAAKTGTVDIVIDATSIDFGRAQLNSDVRGEKLLNTEKFPTVTYKGKAIKFDGETPVAVEGDMTLHGVTKPLTLTINKFKCIQNAVLKREVCGADAAGQFKRTDFGMDYGLPRYSPDIKLLIQIEAIEDK
jgi:polyisoprenoid-binding protein YceI